MPRFKIHSEGERISVDDKILLVSVKGNLHVHVAPNPLPHAHSDAATSKPKFEVTASQVRHCRLW